MTLETRDDLPAVGDDEWHPQGIFHDVVLGPKPVSEPQVRSVNLSQKYHEIYDDFESI